MMLFSKEKFYQLFVIRVNILLTYCVFIRLIIDVNCTDNTYERCWQNLKVYDTLLYPEYRSILATTKENNTIRIFLSTTTNPTQYSRSSYEYHASALTMSYKAFCERGGFEDQDTQFEIVFLADRCTSDVGVPNMFEINDAGGDVVLGMPCSKVSTKAGHYLKHYNIPLISFASNSALLSDKDTYSTVIRLGNGYQQIGRAFVEIMKTFNWQTMSILTRNTGLCRHGSMLIDQAISAHESMTVVEYNEIPSGESDEELLRYLRNFKERSRVLMVCLDSSDTIRLMELAYDQGMTTSEYVYLSFTLMPDISTLQPWGSTQGLDEETIRKRKKAFLNFKRLTPADMIGPGITTLLGELADQMSQYPWYINSTKDLGVTASPYGLYLYDIMTFYLTTVNQSFTQGIDPRNGTYIFQKARNAVFAGVSGDVIIDDQGDRIPNYWLWQLSPGKEENTHFAAIRMISPEGKTVTIVKTPYWGTADGLPPANEPVCGYRKEKCPPSTKGRDAALISGFSCVAVVIIIIFTGIILYRRKVFEDHINKMTWKVFYVDIKFSSKPITGGSVMMSLKSLKSNQSDADVKSIGKAARENEQIFTLVGTYKGTVCVVKKIGKTDCKLSREDLIELKLMKDINHENINSFIGACIQPPNIYILSSYCAKGSLQDILEQDEIKLDWSFKCSLIFDLINGLYYIHHSPLSSHGRLSSAGCLIDSRWVLKISNLGLNSVKYTNIVKKEIGEYEEYRDALWTAPELLRLEQYNRPIKGTQAGDIYSLAIILQEIIFRALPYLVEDLSPKQIIQKVKKHLDPPYRPDVSMVEKDTEPKMIMLMQDCWDENPNFRPDMGTVKKKFTALNKGRKVNILDSMVQKLERYANNLEEIVEKRTEELVLEKKKTDMLLFRMLPSVVAEKLKYGIVVSAEIYENVSIYFSDVVGFTSISSDSSPMQVVDLLNDLYTLFDDIIAKFDVYKVETIGDAYMCVSGCPNRNGNRHAAEIANMSLSLRENVKKFKIRHMPNRPLRIRIGVHTGSCAAGVVGLTMPRYCLFGDTVNVASRMESNGEAMKIHISDTTYEILANMAHYEITCRGEVELKGKGRVTSYWLNARSDSVGASDQAIIHEIKE